MQVLNMIDYKRRPMPNVGYLKAASNRSDGDGLNHEVLARVRAARAWRDGFDLDELAEPQRDGWLVDAFREIRALSDWQKVGLVAFAILAAILIFLR